MTDDDIGSTEYWRDIKEARRARCELNHAFALNELEKHNVEYKILSESHLRVGEFDYWPSTGLFINRKTKRRGRGVKNFLREIGK